MRLDARIEKLDFKRPIFHFPLLAYQLIQTVFVNRAIAVAIDVDAFVVPRCRAVEPHPKSDGFASFPGPSTRCKSRAWNRNTILPPAERDDGLFPAHVPAANQAPLVYVEPSRRRVAARDVRLDSLGRARSSWPVRSRYMFLATLRHSYPARPARPKRRHLQGRRPVNWNPSLSAAPGSPPRICRTLPLRSGGVQIVPLASMK